MFFLISGGIIAVYLLIKFIDKSIGDTKYYTNSKIVILSRIIENSSNMNTDTVSDPSYRALGCNMYHNKDV